MFFLKIRACKSKLQISERNADRDRLIKFLAQEYSILQKKLITLSPNQLLNPCRFKIPIFVDLHCVGANRQLET